MVGASRSLSWLLLGVVGVSATPGTPTTTIPPVDNPYFVTFSLLSTFNVTIRGIQDCFATTLGTRFFWRFKFESLALENDIVVQPDLNYEGVTALELTNRMLTQWKKVSNFVGTTCGPLLDFNNPLVIEQARLCSNGDYVRLSRACPAPPQSNALAIGLAVGASVLLVMIVIALWIYRRWVKKKIEEQKEGVAGPGDVEMADGKPRGILKQDSRKSINRGVSPDRRGSRRGSSPIRGGGGGGGEAAEPRRSIKRAESPEPGQGPRRAESPEPGRPEGGARASKIGAPAPGAAGAPEGPRRQGSRLARENSRNNLRNNGDGAEHSRNSRNSRSRGSRSRNSRHSRNSRNSRNNNSRENSRNRPESDRPSFLAMDVPTGKCANDAFEEATVHCMQCNADYCAKCFDVLHLNKERKGHQHHPLDAPPPIPAPVDEDEPDGPTTGSAAVPLVGHGGSGGSARPAPTAVAVAGGAPALPAKPAEGEADGPPLPSSSPGGPAAVRRPAAEADDKAPPIPSSPVPSGPPRGVVRSKSRASLRLQNAQAEELPPAPPPPIDD